MTGANDQSSAGEGARKPTGDAGILQGFQDLETAVLEACAVEEQWPAQIAAGVYAGVDFAIRNPVLARELVVDSASNIDYKGRYQWIVGRLTGFLRVRAPIRGPLPGSADQALVAGIVGLVGDHLRTDRLDRLAKLRPELVLLTLLPYLGFAEAQKWANRAAGKPD